MRLNLHSFCNKYTDVCNDKLSISLIISDTGLVNFDSFCKVAGHFLENEDDEALQKELKEAFRLYDKEGN